MRPGPASQTGRLLALLELGGWWTTRDLLNEVPSVVHSRISDLRAKGYTIEHKTTGEGAGGSLYRLVGFNATLHETPALAPGSVSHGAPEATNHHAPGAPAVPLPAEEGTLAAERPLSQQLAFSALTPEEDKPHMYRREGRAA